MGFCLYGNDIDDNTSPIEGGLAWITKFTKAFTNADNIKLQKEKGVRRKLVGFKMLDKGIPRHDYTIKTQDSQEIGKVTSGTISPVLGTGIGLGYVLKEYATPNATIYIDVRGKLLKAQITKPPFI